jgi:pyruvate formate lyase activating enzyme
MPDLDYLESDLRHCKLCEWRCGVDRLDGETGLCGINEPLVAASQLHPAPPASFDAFMIGCNFKCLFCQNWSISMHDASADILTREIEGYYDPQTWAELGVTCLTTSQARVINADRLFFTGGEPSCSLPWVEAVVEAAREIIPNTQVNFDTNGFLTKDSLKRVLRFTDSITYDLKAFDSELFRALTGASVKPVLRNLRYIIKNSPESLWEVRVMLIPGVHEPDIENICKFLAENDETINLNFLAFRPNFIMENYLGATIELLEMSIEIARKYDLKNATWSGRPGINGKLPDIVKKIMKNYTKPKYLSIPLSFSQASGCVSKIRNCGVCKKNKNCPIKYYRPQNIY